jgi:plasmid stabilization system protein ParE
LKPITFHPSADVEIVEAGEYYENLSPGLGLDLLGEVERALDQIAKYPESCQRIGKRTRRKALRRFHYNLIYAVYPERIRIVAFAHQKRRPYYWRRRLRDLAE